MTKKTVNQNTRFEEKQLAFLGAVAVLLGTNRSDVVRRFVREWQRFGAIGAAEALRSCDQERHVHGRQLLGKLDLD